MNKSVLACAVILLASLTACENMQQPAPEPIETTPTKIVFDVATVDLADRSGPVPENSPYDTNHFSPTVPDAIKKWAKDRLQASGQSGHAAMVIKDASFTVEGMDTDKSIHSWFTRQQGLKYSAHADVYIEVNNPAGYGSTEATASRSVTLPENPAPTEKQNAYYNLMNGLMKDLSNNIESGIAAHLYKFTMSPYSSSMNGGDAALDLHGPSTVTSAPIATETPIISRASDMPVAAKDSTVSSQSLPPLMLDDPVIIDGSSEPSPAVQPPVIQHQAAMQPAPEMQPSSVMPPPAVEPLTIVPAQPPMPPPVALQPSPAMQMPGDTVTIPLSPPGRY